VCSSDLMLGPSGPNEMMMLHETEEVA